MIWNNSLLFLFWGTVGLIVYFIVLSINWVAFTLSSFIQFRFKERGRKNITPQTVSGSRDIYFKPINNFKAPVLRVKPRDQKMFSNYRQTLIVNDPLKPLNN